MKLPRRPRNLLASTSLCVLALVVACSLFAQVFPVVSNLLAYDRDRVAAGELWRLVTGHVPHDSFRHFAYDAVAMVFLGIACERLRAGSAAKAIGLAAAVISFVLLPLSPEVTSYRGLSALATSLYACVLGSMIADGLRDHDARRLAIAAILLLGFVAKTSFEALRGAPLFAPDPGVHPWPLAHLVGAAAGLAAALPPPFIKSIVRSSRSPKNQLLCPSEVES